MDSPVDETLLDFACCIAKRCPSIVPAAGGKTLRLEGDRPSMLAYFEFVKAKKAGRSDQSCFQVYATKCGKPPATRYSQYILIVCSARTVWIIRYP